MTTDLLYMQDFDVETCEATVVSVAEATDDRQDVVLNQTCFYPRGGGQDWDCGVLKTDKGVRLEVEEVLLDPTGIVHHIGRMVDGMLQPGDQVAGTVDRERRVVNTRLHSAGHAIDMAVDSLGLDWVGTKGQHYPYLSALEYSGTWEPERAEALRVDLQTRVNEITAQATANTIVFMPVADMHTVCRHVPPNIPTNKPARVVLYGPDFGIPCGGTHVKNLQDIGTITIPKLKEKKGVIRVSYQVTGIGEA